MQSLGVQGLGLRGVTRFRGLVGLALGICRGRVQG